LKLYPWIIILLLAGCATAPQTSAPVIERAPTSKKAAPSASASKKPATAEKDWRPDTYTVKKGDTLYSLGLEFGYDHKELAQWNNIPPPYRIYVGQVLRLKDPKAVAITSAVQPAPATPVAPADPDAAVVTPLNMDAAPVARPLDGSAPPIEGAPIKSDVIPVLTEPKAIKEPYSAKAMTAEPAPKPVSPKPAVPAPATPEKPVAAEAPKPEAAKPESSKPETAPDKPAAPADDEDVDWSWPAKGKVLAGYSDGGSKGIDIAGEQGQAVLAAAPGKVVYSGAGLRGYGKLIIIKHNKTYLSAYAHNSQLLVKEGQAIAKGQKIAEMGNSDTDRVKLHFEIRKLGRPVDPAKYLPEDPH
jgi:lipoprotein NlpD